MNKARYLPYFGHLQEVALQFNPVPVLLKGERIIDPLSLMARVARGFPTLYSAKESGKGKVNAQGDVLQQVGMNGSQFQVAGLPPGKVFLLLVLGDAFACGFVQVGSFVNEAIVHLPQHFQCPAKPGFLLGGRIQAVFDTNDVHALIIPNTASDANGLSSSEYTTQARVRA